MALQFDMSKNNWQQDLMLQEQMRELGENIGDAGVVAGGALGKVLGKTFLPEGGKNLPNWFKKTNTAEDKFAKAKADWEKKIEDVWATRASDVTNDMKGEYIEKYAPGLIKERPLRKDYKADYKFTPGKGLKGLGEGVLGTGLGIGEKIYKGGKAMYQGGKKAADTAVDLFIGDKDMLDQFEGSQDSPLMKALKQRKANKANKLAEEKRKAEDKKERAEVKKQQTGPKFKSTKFKKAKFKTP